VLGRTTERFALRRVRARPRYGRAICGRARLSSDVSEIMLVFAIPPHRPTPNIAPGWNVAPTDPSRWCAYDVRNGERALLVSEERDGQPTPGGDFERARRDLWGTCQV
jgi:hypothetical protein